tara:strand:- start:19 stop:216 length:198 start_codon:yes stop_codon:yes gene_type:complete
MTKIKNEIKELGFHDSYYSEGFKESIPVINSLLEPYGIQIHTKFYDAISEPEWRWHIKIERSKND